MSAMRVRRSSYRSAPAVVSQWPVVLIGAAVMLAAVGTWPRWACAADQKADADVLSVYPDLLLHAGISLYREQDYQGAQSQWEQALTIYRELGLEKGEATTLYSLGLVADDLAQYDKARGYYEQALPIQRKLGLEEDAAGTFVGLGNVACELSQYDKAQGYYAQALAAFQKLGLEKGAAATLNNLGVVADDLAQYDKAVSYWQQAWEICRKLGLEENAANLVRNLGNLALKGAQYDEALGYYERALASYRKMGSKKSAADTLNNLAVVVGDLGQYARALGYYGQALATYRQLGLEKDAADTLGNLGNAAVDLGQYDKAQGNFEQALATYRKLGLEKDAAKTVSNLGVVAEGLGQYDKALDCYEQAGAALRKLGLEQDASTAEMDAFDLQLSQGRLAEARAYVVGLGVITDLPRSGRFHLLAGEPKPAAARFKEAASEAGQDFSARVASQIGLGLAQEALGEYEEAAAAYRQAVDLIEQARAQTPRAERGGFFAAKAYGFSRLEAYEGLVRMQHRLGNDEEALYWSEHAKARALVEALARTPYGMALGLPPELRKQEDDLGSQVEALSRRLAETPELRATIEPQITPLQKRIDDLIVRLRKEYPDYASMKYPQPLRASEMKSDLKPGEVLLEYEVTEPESFAFLVRAGQVKAFEIKISRKELTERIKQYRNGFELVSARLGIGEKAGLKEEVDLALSQQLYELLLKEPLGQIGQGEQVAIVPDGAIGLLPLEGLAESAPTPLIWKDGKHGPIAEGVRYVGDDGRVFTYWQSGTSLSTVRRLQRGAYGQQVLVVADPVFDEADERLHGTPPAQAPPKQPEGRSSLAAEVRAGLSQALGLGGQGFSRLRRGRDLAEGLRAAYGDKITAWVDLNANESKLKKEPLSGYGEVVFFTHGVLDEEVPVLRQPALVLSLVRNEPGEDGYLTMGEVMDLKLRAEVAGLMACHSGAGRLVSGEGVMGMGRAFQYAGARSVLASLWYVNAASTNDLTEAFLRGISQGQDKAQSLASAHDALRQAGYDHPYYWAPFILIGEAGFAGVVKQ